MKIFEWIVLAAIIYFAVLMAAESSARMQEQREKQRAYDEWLRLQQQNGNGGAPVV